jgi:hypothetical protein
MKRLDCLGSSGFFEFFPLNVVFSAFVTGPSILCPLLAGISQQATLLFQPHGTLGISCRNLGKPVPECRFRR